ncbi:melanoregulin [Polymixia lowei]
MRTRTAVKPPEPVLSESSDSDPGDESLFGPEPSRRSPGDIQASLRSTTDSWPTPNSPRISTGGHESDGELQAFITMRNQTDKDTEEWEKLNYDIHTLRYARREVSTRWKKILRQLGYQCEVEALLCVNKQSQLSRDGEHLNRTGELLQQLLDHTSLFLPGTGPQGRYLYVMDRLVSLDSAEDFIRLAKQKYPKTEG